VSAFAALKADGSITTWGASGGRGAPSDGGYINIYSTNNAFAALAMIEPSALRAAKARLLA
jgi:hypothetical protein